MKNPLELVTGWHLKALCAAIMVGLFSAGIGTLWLTYKATEKDRGAIIGWAENVCASVGTPYRVNAKDKPLKRDAWGKDCAATILRLATNASAAAQAALTVVVDHDADQVTKGATYHATARRSASRVQSGQQQMEQAIDASQDDLVGPGFFHGLNQSLGLRPYIAAGAAAAPSGDSPEGDAGRGAAEVQ